MKKASFIILAGVLLLWANANAQQQTGPVIYPSKGQSPQQTEQDRNACYSWAQQQTGFNPAAALQAQQGQQQPQTQSGGAASGAAGGAAGGAIGGAIAGSAGKGAAIGGGIGAAAGALKKRRGEQEQQQAAATQQQEQSRKLAEYNKAFSACMEGRGYTVK